MINTVPCRSVLCQCREDLHHSALIPLTVRARIVRHAAGGSAGTASHHVIYTAQQCLCSRTGQLLACVR
jgi:hypothetical protein